MKRMMLIGKTGVGKTSLIQALKNEELSYKKTQALEFIDGIIDTPGEYLENRRYYNAIITMSFDVSIVVLVHDAKSDDSYFPPGFAGIFNRKVIGIITKIDSENANIKRARKILENAGAGEIFEVSALKRIGLSVIENLLVN